MTLHVCVSTLRLGAYECQLPAFPMHVLGSSLQGSSTAMTAAHDTLSLPGFRGGSRDGARFNLPLVVPQVGQVHAVQHLRRLKVAEVNVDFATVLGLICIDVVEGEVGWGLDVTNLGLVAVQRH